VVGVGWWGGSFDCVKDRYIFICLLTRNQIQRKKKKKKKKKCSPKKKKSKEKSFVSMHQQQ
jgi:hypothetical protein